jgi:hypothetical protein
VTITPARLRNIAIALAALAMMMASQLLLHQKVVSFLVEIHRTGQVDLDMEYLAAHLDSEAMAEIAETMQLRARSNLEALELAEESLGKLLWRMWALLAVLMLAAIVLFLRSTPNNALERPNEN